MAAGISWTDCKMLAISFLDSQDATKSYPTKLCIYEFNSNDWLNSPCCNPE